MKTKQILIFTIALILSSCLDATSWQPATTFFLSTYVNGENAKPLGECRMLSDTGGGVHSFTYKTAVANAYVKGKQNGEIQIIEESSDHAVWKLKQKTFAAFNSKDQCSKYQFKN